MVFATIRRYFQIMIRSGSIFPGAILFALLRFAVAGEYHQPANADANRLTYLDENDPLKSSAAGWLVNEIEWECGNCTGTGTRKERPCRICKGKGWVEFAPPLIAAFALCAALVRGS